MSLVTIFSDANDQKRVIGGKITMPRVGVWHAALTVESDDQFNEGDSVTIGVNDGAQFFNGTVARALLYQGIQQVRVLGGAGGMQTVTKPKHYQGPLTSDVIADMANDAGETVAGDSDAGVSIPGWTTIAATFGRQLAELVRPIAGAVWRIRADGSLWVGVEQWEASTVPDDEWATLDYDHLNGVLHLGMVAPTLLPGTTFGQEKIDRVEHSISGDVVRTDAWVWRGMPAGPDHDFQAVSRAAPRPVDFYSLYGGVTKSQDGQKFDVQPDDDRLPTMGKIPIRHGVPSLEATVGNGARVLIGWEGGDPRLPYCALWGGGEKTSKMTLNVGTLTIVADKIQLGSDGLGDDPNNGLVHGTYIDPFTGATALALGGTCTKVFGKK